MCELYRETRATIGTSGCGGAHPGVRKRKVVRVGNSVIASAGLVTSDDGTPDRAFEAVVVADVRRLFALALSILDDRGEAEDAVQETLLKAWRAWDSLSRMDRQAAWLTRVCVNHCISRRRMLRSRGFPLPGLINRASPSTSSGDDAQRIDMDRAYRRLSRKQRAAIALNYRHGYSVDECAAFMGCRAGTVRTHLERGLAKLRKELKDD
jgi:RNA polymerase sigma factor (sigma-70 family)